MDQSFDIYRDETMACLLADYVIWAERQGSLGYEMPAELREQIELEVKRISRLHREMQRSAKQEVQTSGPGF